ncbi:unnamed protein product [Pedinophyceae sp. YPF-701]|nr:unnamed protein product [Pedinophyceae sp. YPF-701]
MPFENDAFGPPRQPQRPSHTRESSGAATADSHRMGSSVEEAVLQGTSDLLGTNNTLWSTVNSTIRSQTLGHQGAHVPGPASEYGSSRSLLNASNVSHTGVGHELGGSHLRPALPARDWARASGASAAGAQQRGVSFAGSGGAGTHGGRDTQSWDWESQVPTWFKMADADRDGEVGGQEAAAFLKKSGLSQDDLFHLWNAVKGGSGRGLSPAEFLHAMRMIGLVQAGIPVQRAAQEMRETDFSRFPEPVLAGIPRGAAPAPGAAAHTQSLHSGLPPRHTGGEAGLSAAMGQLRTSGHGGLETRLSTDTTIEDILGDDEADEGGSFRGRRSNSRVSDTPGGTPASLSKSFPPGYPVHTVLRHPPRKGAESITTCMATCAGSVFVGPTSGRPGAFVQVCGVGSKAGPSIPPGSVPPSDSDIDAAPHIELSAPGAGAVTCLCPDHHRGMLWSGHVGGTVCCWSVPQNCGEAVLARAFSAAKSGHISSIAILPSGDIVTGSSWGYLKIWTRPAGGWLGGASGSGVNAALESPGVAMAAPGEEIDMRKPYEELPHDEVRFLAVPRCGRVLWSGGKHNLGLWDAETGLFLGSTGQGDAAKYIVPRSLGLPLLPTGRVDVAQTPGAVAVAQSDAWKGQAMVKRGRARIMNLTKVAMRRIGDLTGMNAQQVHGRSPSDEAQGAPNTSGGQFPYGALRALIPVGSDEIWAGYRSGRIEVYHYSGRQEGGSNVPGGITCMQEVAGNVWIGLADGRVVVYSEEMQLLSVIAAHTSPVCSAGQVGAVAVTLAGTGALHAWAATLQGSESNEAAITRQWRHAVAQAAYSTKDVRIAVGTWNVAEQKPEPSDLIKWLEGAARAEVVAVALQEVDMSYTGVVSATAAEVMGRGATSGGAVGRNWTLALAAALEAAGGRWEVVAGRCLGGVLLAVFCRDGLAPVVGEVETAAVSTGVMGLGANKGAVGIRFTVLRRTFVVVGSHLSAHTEMVTRRDEEFHLVCSKLRFRRPLHMPSAIASRWEAARRVGANDNASNDPAALVPAGWGDDAGLDDVSTSDVRDVSDQGRDKTDASSIYNTSTLAPLPSAGGGRLGSLTMHDSDVLIWAGDLNYRVNLTYDECIELINDRDFKGLLQQCQLMESRRLLRAFGMFTEGRITFPPTYKFEKGAPGLKYDAEKRRPPSYTDRVLFRATAGSHPLCPTVTCRSYGSSMDVVASDHKPVLAQLSVHLPHVAVGRHRAAFYEALAGEIDRTAATAKLQVRPKDLQFLPEDQELRVRLTNPGDEPIAFRVSSHLGSASGGGPTLAEDRWFDVWPDGGVLQPGGWQEISAEWLAGQAVPGVRGELGHGNMGESRTGWINIQACTLNAQGLSSQMEAPSTVVRVLVREPGAAAHGGPSVRGAGIHHYHSGPGPYGTSVGSQRMALSGASTAEGSAHGHVAPLAFSRPVPAVRAQAMQQSPSHPNLRRSPAQAQEPRASQGTRPRPQPIVPQNTAGTPEFLSPREFSPGNTARGERPLLDLS